MSQDVWFRLALIPIASGIVVTIVVTLDGDWISLVKCWWRRRRKPSHPPVVHLACLRSSPPPCDLAYIYTCYQCRASAFAGKILNAVETEGPRHVRCPMVEHEDA